MDLYRQVILDHYKHPHNFGHLPHATHTAESYNATCGDKITMEIRLKKGNKKGSAYIDDIRFHGEGCAISQAAASLLTELVKEKHVDAVMKLGGDDVVALLGTPLTPSRVKCATLPLEVIHKAIQSK